MDGGSGNSTTINDLDDNMLTQILFRLPSYAPAVLSCKLVNKRWCSLISDPTFASYGSTHKRKSTTLSKLGHNIDEDEPPFTFMFGFPKLSLDFLPCDFAIEATFMDLVLCSDISTREGRGRIYYITNPVTKQWVALPPCPYISDNEWPSMRWAALVCEQPYDNDYTQNYKFRVVVIDRCPPPVYELLVYCSEIGEWKKFNLSVSISPWQRHLYYNTEFQGVVCNGIIYLHHKLYFAALNPFDVDKTTDTSTIQAKVLPSVPIDDGYLRVSCGQLFFIHIKYSNNEYYVWYDKHGLAIDLCLEVWKLDPNQIPLIWKTNLDGYSSTGNVNEIGYINRNYGSVSNVGIHPKNEKLIYMHLEQEEKLVLCDTQTRLIKPIKFLSRSNLDLETFDRLELQWWPTPVPKAYLSNASQ